MVDWTAVYWAGPWVVCWVDAMAVMTAARKGCPKAVWRADLMAVNWVVMTADQKADRWVALRAA